MGLVSKVLSGKMGTTGVTAEKRERILATAKARGFVPNRTARALRSGRIGTIGVFLHPLGERGVDINDNFLRGFSQGLAASSHHLWLTFFERRDDFERTLEQIDISRQADALVVAGLAHPELTARLEELDRTQVPVIISEEDVFSPQVPNISIDTFAQGRLPTQHLIARGCRRIAEVSRLPSRHRGYLEAMHNAGLETEDLVVTVPDFKVADGRLAVRQLLERGISFDGLVCHSDYQALGAIQELLARQIRVPEQVRVTGVDDSVVCDLSPVPITSVTGEGQVIGLATAKAVLERLDGKQVFSQSIQPQIVERASA
jgi:LacI family transcriptional regulator